MCFNAEVAVRMAPKEERRMPGWWKKTLDALSGGQRKKEGGDAASGPQRGPQAPREEPPQHGAPEGLTGDEMRHMAEREYPLLHDDRERLARMVATDIKRALRDERRQAGEGGDQPPGKHSRH